MNQEQFMNVTKNHQSKFATPTYGNLVLTYPNASVILNMTYNERATISYWDGYKLFSLNNSAPTINANTYSSPPATKPRFPEIISSSGLVGLMSNEQVIF